MFEGFEISQVAEGGDLHSTEASDPDIQTSVLETLQRDFPDETAQFFREHGPESKQMLSGTKTPAALGIALHRICEGIQEYGLLHKIAKVLHPEEKHAFFALIEEIWKRQKGNAGG